MLSITPNCLVTVKVVKDCTQQSMSNHMLADSVPVVNSANLSRNCSFLGGCFKTKLSQLIAQIVCAGTKPILDLLFSFKVFIRTEL